MMKFFWPSLVFTAIILSLAYNYRLQINQSYLLFEKQQLVKQGNELNLQNRSLISEISSLSAQIRTLEQDDQRLINQNLINEISSISATYKKTMSILEDLIDLRDSGVKTSKLEHLLSPVLSDLADRKYLAANLKIATVAANIKAEKSKISNAPIGLNLSNIPESNSPPSSGFSRQKVNVDGQQFVVDVIAADLNNVKVIVDTASDSDCQDNCPVLPLSSYVSRNSAIAGINGSYFCPSSYPSCSSKKNSFDTLLMNKNKKYFNSDNNVYSSVPAMIFSGSSVRVVGKTQEWGRDTGVDAVIANHPLLVSNRSAVGSDNVDAKLSSTGNRAFIGNRGNVVYIGVVRGVSVVGVAKVLAAMGLDNALNLDSGGSTALWSGGYKVGPGRDIPNAILFVRR